MRLSDSRSCTLLVIHSQHSQEFFTSNSCHCGSPRFLADLSTRAVPKHPGEPGSCFCPLLHRRWQASAVFEDWPLPSFDEAESGSLTLGSRVRLAGLRQSRLLAPAPARLRVERANYTMTSLQVTRSARLPGAQKRTQIISFRKMPASPLAAIPPRTSLDPIHKV